MSLHFFYKKKSHLYKTRPSTIQSAKLNRFDWIIIGAFCFYVTGEVSTSMWLTTYLVESDKISVPEAVWYLSGFFLVLGFSRILSFIFMKEKYESLAIKTCLVLAIASLLLGVYRFRIFFCFVGIFGPFFPVFMARISRSYPLKWRSLIVYIIAVMQIGLVCVHLCVGNIVEDYGVQYAILIPPTLLALCLGLTSYYLNSE